MEAFRDTSEATPGPLHFPHIPDSGFTLKQRQMDPGVRVANMAAEPDLDNTTLSSSYTCNGLNVVHTAQL